MPTLPLYQVDAFTHRVFSGNPAAVCLHEFPIDDEMMQSIAAEMNLSETAFAHIGGAPDQPIKLRWFTPTTEVPLCGHATLATSFVLAKTDRSAHRDVIVYDTKSGLLKTRLKDDRIALDFPARPVTKGPLPEGLIDILPQQPVFSGRCENIYLVELSDPELVIKMHPDFDKLSKVNAQALIVTSRSVDTQYHFVSRFFAPRMGINEDPVTGVAHCSLAPYWAAKLGLTSMQAYQASKRGGELIVSVTGDGVTLSGSAVMVSQGELYC